MDRTKLDAAIVDFVRENGLSRAEINVTVDERFDIFVELISQQCTKHEGFKLVIQ